jgi:hypothetical protein
MTVFAAVAEYFDPDQILPVVLCATGRVRAEIRKSESHNPA